MGGLNCFTLEQLPPRRAWCDLTPACPLPPFREPSSAAACSLSLPDPYELTGPRVLDRQPQLPTAATPDELQTEPRRRRAHAAHQRRVVDRQWPRRPAAALRCL